MQQNNYNTGSVISASTGREQTIAERRARIDVGQVSHEQLATALVDYGQGGEDGALVKLASGLWPVAHSHFSDVRHGRFEVGVSVPFENPQVLLVMGLRANKKKGTAEPTTEAILAKSWVEAPQHERPSVTLAKLKGMGWGNYPIVKGGAHALGSQITWKVKAGQRLASRSIIPTTPQHKATIRKCNQILAEAESQTLYFLEVNSTEAERLKKMWRARPSVRYLAIPQELNRTILVHSEASEGGNELGAMSNEYGKAELYALVEGWMGNKPKGKRVKPCDGWGKRYKLAKGHNAASLAAQATQATAVANGQSGATFSLTTPNSPRVMASAVNSTVSEEGHGIDYTPTVKGDVDTYVELGLVKPLEPNAYANVNRIEAILKSNQNEAEAKGHILPENTMSLSSPSSRENAPSFLSADSPNQRNSPAETDNPTTQRISRVKRKATTEQSTAVQDFFSKAQSTNEVTPC